MVRGKNPGLAAKIHGPPALVPGLPVKDAEPAALAPEDRVNESGNPNNESEDPRKESGDLRNESEDLRNEAEKAQPGGVIPGGGGSSVRRPSRIPLSLATAEAWFPRRSSRSQA